MEIISKNKKAYFDYEILEKYQAGLVLYGSEIKSIRNRNVAIKDAFIKIDSNFEAFVYNFIISQYQHSSLYLVSSEREKKLLLNKRELIKLRNEVMQKGLSLIPLELIIDDNSRAKLIFGLCRGKKKFDKRASLKTKTVNRDIERSLKSYKY